MPGKKCPRKIRSVQGLVAISLLLIPLGAVCDRLNVMAPVHELGHMLLAWLSLSGAWISGWSECMIAEPNAFNVAGAHFFEMLFFGGMVVYTAVRAPRKIFLSAFSLGVFHDNIFYALQSEDWNVGLTEFISKYAIDGLMTFWSVMNAVALIFLWILFVAHLCYRSRHFNDGPPPSTWRLKLMGPEPPVYHRRYPRVSPCPVAPGEFLRQLEPRSSDPGRTSITGGGRSPNRHPGVIPSRPAPGVPPLRHPCLPVWRKV